MQQKILGTLQNDASEIITYHNNKNLQTGTQIEVLNKAVGVNIVVTAFR